jgi:hypothetical protein
MPAPETRKKENSSVYFHIYNKSVENRNLFNDQEDYEVFLNYLKDYLTSPESSESIKKTFMINGRTFRGIPHQPKNYYNKVDLIAYRLDPKKFHLLVHQKVHGSVAGFIRSLCTRYSIYYNKKYRRTGSLFEGPYKSVEFSDSHSLLLLTKYFHKNSQYSSYAEYLGDKTTPWVQKNVIHLDQVSGKNYKYFVEQYELTDEESQILERIIFEDKTKELEEGNLETQQNVLIPDVPVPIAAQPKSRSAIFFATSAAFYLLLIGIGFNHVKTSKAININSEISLSEPTPQVAGSEDQKPEPTPNEILQPDSSDKKMVVVVSGTEEVNIRKEPTTNSEIFSKAKDGDTFNFISKVDNWYQIKIDENNTAYISDRYADELEEKGEENE